MEILVIWLVFCALIAKVAKDRGRDAVAWFFVAFLISPLVAGVIVLVLPRSQPADPSKPAGSPIPEQWGPDWRPGQRQP